MQLPSDRCNPKGLWHICQVSAYPIFNVDWTTLSEASHLLGNAATMWTSSLIGVARERLPTKYYMGTQFGTWFRRDRTSILMIMDGYRNWSDDQIILWVKPLLPYFHKIGNFRHFKAPLSIERLQIIVCCTTRLLSSYFAFIVSLGG